MRAVQSMRVPTHGRIRPTSPTRARKQWGGFLLVRRNPQLLHVRLTGQFDQRAIRGICRAVEQEAVASTDKSTTLFVVLDASRLDHISIADACELSELEPRWRARGIVALWIGLSKYLANLLTLACGNEQQLPALADWSTAQRVFAEVRDHPAPLARCRLVSSSELVH
ncbi:hypothetical protein DRQ53_09260 [bacterium]|nr:MAG: hypothetical protein DRQ53_09260 [bacterium]